MVESGVTEWPGGVEHEGGGGALRYGSQNLVVLMDWWGWWRSSKKTVVEEERGRGGGISGGRERPGGTTVVEGEEAARRVAQGTCVTPNTCGRRVRKSVFRRRCLPLLSVPPAACGVLAALTYLLTFLSRLGGSPYLLSYSSFASWYSFRSFLSCYS